MLVRCRSTVLLVAPMLWIIWPQSTQPQSSNGMSAGTTASVEASKPEDELKNPVKPTPESLGVAKKIFGYDCAMCHGSSADGKGDLAASMGLKMSDWRDSQRIVALSDGEIFHLIVKGKGRMVGEGDRYSVEIVWDLVNYVRTFGKNEVATLPKTPAASH
jgi:mono/diheme cytochrome c family protein